MRNKKQGFVYGAFILMLSGILVKAVGAFFKIPLANIIGDTAMGYFNSAYSIYSMCFLISTAGLPVAISRMIAGAKAGRRTEEIHRIYRISLLIFMGIGLLGTALLFFGAEGIAAFPGEPELALCIKAISPIMFFICLVACIRGYFQGHQNMTPTAVSQIIEALGKLALGLVAAIFATRRGYPPVQVAAYALGGVTFGVVLSAVFLSVCKTRSENEVLEGESAPCRGRRELAKELISIAIPITLSSSILSLTSVIDSMLAVRRLNETCVGSLYFPIGSAAPVAVTLLGAYMAKSVTLFNLTPTVIAPFAVSIIPAISSAKEKGNTAGFKKTLDFSFLMVTVITLPAAFGLGLLAEPILELLFTSNEAIFLSADGAAFLSNRVAAPMLTLLAPAVVFSGLVSVSGAVLQGSGWEQKSILSTFLGVGAKALSSWILIGIPSIGYLGIPLSTLICYLVMFSTNLYFLSRYASYRIQFRKVLFRPLFCSLCLAVAVVVFRFATKYFLPASVSTVGAILFAALIYAIVLFKSGSFSKEDVLMLPKGEHILSFLTKCRLIRKR